MHIHKQKDGTVIVPVPTWYQPKVRFSLVKPSDQLPKDSTGVDTSALQKIPVEFWIETGSDDPALEQVQICKVEFTPLYCEHKVLVGISTWFHGHDQQVSFVLHDYPPFSGLLQCDVCASEEESGPALSPDDEPPAE